MVIQRVFNNNAVAVITEDGEEAVLIGSGIGFNKKRDDKIDYTNVEKIYYMQSELQTRFSSILSNTRLEYFEIAEDIFKYAERIGYKSSIPAIMALTDHISFAIERKSQGIFAPNLMINEIKSFYPLEFELGSWAVRHIDTKFGYELGKDEAGYIALHVISSISHKNSSETVKTLKFVKGSIKCIEDCYGIDTSVDKFNQNRLITHLKYLSKRIFIEDKYNNKDLAGIYEFLLRKNSKHQYFIKEYQKYVKENFEYELEEAELVYILIHITKMLET